jgi:hypothetical protein
VPGPCLGSQELQQKSAALLQRKEELERRRKQIQKESKKVRDSEDLHSICCSMADDMCLLSFSRLERRRVWHVLTHSLACLFTQVHNALAASSNSMDGMNMMGEGSADGAVIDDLQVRCACKPPDPMVLLLTANADWESSPSIMPVDLLLS